MSVKPPAEQVQPLRHEEKFSFACGPELSCFTECCRSLDLVLTPYDVLRLRQRLSLNSHDFLERYAVVEEREDEAFPLVFLAMVDDGRASCPFVAASGCTVYEDRPAACRAYPLGRGVRQTGCGGGKTQELFVLVREPHCRGFELKEKHDATGWMADQGLTPYNLVSDALLPLLRHPKTQKGWRPEAFQQEQYLQSLYQLEKFHQRVVNAEVALFPSDSGDRWSAAELAELDDLELLLFAIAWLKQAYKL